MAAMQSMNTHVTTTSAVTLSIFFPSSLSSISGLGSVAQEFSYTSGVCETPASSVLGTRGMQAGDCQCSHTVRSRGSPVRSPPGLVGTPSSPCSPRRWCT